MKTIIALVFLVSASIAQADMIFSSDGTTYNQIGGMVFGSDGSSAIVTPQGSTWNDGTSFQQVTPSYTIDNYGNSYEQIGNTTYDSSYTNSVTIYGAEIE